MMQTAPAARRFVKALRATEKRMEKSLSKNKTLIANDENGSGGCGVCESASRDRKAHGKIFVKMIKHAISCVSCPVVSSPLLTSRVSRLTSNHVMATP